MKSFALMFEGLGIERYHCRAPAVSACRSHHATISRATTVTVVLAHNASPSRKSFRSMYRAYSLTHVLVILQTSENPRLPDLRQIEQAGIAFSS